MRDLMGCEFDFLLLGPALATMGWFGIWVEEVFTYLSFLVFRASDTPIASIFRNIITFVLQGCSVV